MYPEDDLDDRRSAARYGDGGRGSVPYPADGGMDSMIPGSQSMYNYGDKRPIYRTASPPRESSYRSSRDKQDSKIPGSFPDDDRQRRDADMDRRVRYSDLADFKNDRGDRRGVPDDDDARHRRYDDDRDKYRRDRNDEDRPRVRHASPPRDKYGHGEAISEDKLKFLPQKYSRRYEDDKDDARNPRRDQDRRNTRDYDNDDLAYGAAAPPRASRPESPPTYGSYIPSSKVDDRRSSKYDRRHDDSDSDEDDRRRRPAVPATAESFDSKKSRREPANVLTVEPPSRTRDRSRDRRRDKSPGPSSLVPEPQRKERERSRDRRGSTRDRSPQPPVARMSSLTVDSGRSSGTALTLAAAPGSPLLESYKGTYQDCSPMPSPLLIASQSHDEMRIVEALSPLNSDVEGDGRDGKKRSRRARFHDPEEIATRLAKALKGDKPPDTEPLIDILPSLSHDQVMELRTEYKRLVKTGSDRKGVNVAKHIRARLKDEDGNLMKACYSVALGKWEGEAYWANFWYQGDKTRRELLIESLMGRTNEEIRHIKDAFTDKKYDNSLAKCMKMELKEDKFKKAVLAVLEERRDDDIDPRTGRSASVDYELVDRDVVELHRGVKAEKGGESAMINIVVKRSDTHLRLVLKEYERSYKSNFAREALKKSGNLVVSWRHIIQ